MGRTDRVKKVFDFEINVENPEQKFKKLAKEVQKHVELTDATLKINLDTSDLSAAAKIIKEFQEKLGIEIDITAKVDALKAQIKEAKEQLKELQDPFAFNVKMKDNERNSFLKGIAAEAEETKKDIEKLNEEAAKFFASLPQNKNRRDYSESYKEDLKALQDEYVLQKQLVEVRQKALDDIKNITRTGNDWKNNKEEVLAFVEALKRVELINEHIKDQREEMSKAEAKLFKDIKPETSSGYDKYSKLAEDFALGIDDVTDSVKKHITELNKQKNLYEKLKVAVDELANKTVDSSKLLKDAKKNLEEGVDSKSSAEKSGVSVEKSANVVSGGGQVTITGNQNQVRDNTAAITVGSTNGAPVTVSGNTAPVQITGSNNNVVIEKGAFDGKSVDNIVTSLNGLKQTLDTYKNIKPADTEIKEKSKTDNIGKQKTNSAIGNSVELMEKVSNSAKVLLENVEKVASTVNASINKLNDTLTTGGKLLKESLTGAQKEKLKIDADKKHLKSSVKKASDDAVKELNAVENRSKLIFKANEKALGTSLNKAVAEISKSKSYIVQLDAEMTKRSLNKIRNDVSSSAYSGFDEALKKAQSKYSNFTATATSVKSSKTSGTSYVKNLSRSMANAQYDDMSMQDLRQELLGLLNDGIKKGSPDYFVPKDIANRSRQSLVSYIEQLKKAKAEVAEQAEYEKRYNEQIKIRLQLEGELSSLRDKLVQKAQSLADKLIDEEDVKNVKDFVSGLKEIDSATLSNQEATPPVLQSGIDFLKEQSEWLDEIDKKNKDLIKAKKDEAAQNKELAKQELERVRAAERREKQTSLKGVTEPNADLKDIKELREEYVRLAEAQGALSKGMFGNGEHYMNFSKQRLIAEIEALRDRSKVLKEEQEIRAALEKGADEENEKQLNQQISVRLKLEKEIASIRDSLLKKISSQKASLVSEKDVEVVERIESSLQALTQKELANLSMPGLSETLEELSGIDKSYDKIISDNNELVKANKEKEKLEKESAKAAKDRAAEEKKASDEAYKLSKKQTDLLQREQELREKIAELRQYSGTDKDALNTLEKTLNQLNIKERLGLGDLDEAKNIESVSGALKNVDTQLKNIGKSVEKPINYLRDLRKQVGSYLGTDTMRNISGDNLSKNYFGSEEQLNKIAEYRDKIVNLYKELQDMDRNLTPDEYDSKLKEFRDNVVDLENIIDRTSKKSLFGERQGIISDNAIKGIKEYRDLIMSLEGIDPNAKNLRWTEKQKGDIQTLTASYEAENGAIKTVTYSIDTLNGSYQKLNATEKQQLSFTQRLTKLFEQRSEALIAYIGTFASFYRVAGKLREGVEIIKLLDTNMTELRRVSGATAEELNNFKATVFDTGREIGSTGDNIIKLAADYARLGYSLKESSELARSSAMYMNVGFIEDANFAMESLTSTMKAYGMQASQVTEIVDKFNEVGKKLLPLNGYIGQRVGTPETKQRLGILPQCA